MIRALLDGGADPCIPDLHGNTPLMRAAWGAKTEVVRCLLENSDAGVNLLNKDGCTALWFAAFYGRVVIVKMLLSAGADWKVCTWPAERSYPYDVDFSIISSPILGMRCMSTDTTLCLTL
jgi:ankyrin repeat protein